MDNFIQSLENFDDLIGAPPASGWSTVHKAKVWLAPSAAIPDTQEIRRRQEQLRRDSWAACLEAATRQVGVEESAGLNPEMRYWFIEGFMDSAQEKVQPLENGGEAALASFQAGHAARRNPHLMLKVEMCAYWLQEALPKVPGDGIG